MSTSSDRPKKPKRKPISSDADVKAAKLGDTPVTGARSLFLRVHAAKDRSHTRSWFVRLPGSGKRPKRGLGSYPVVDSRRSSQKGYRRSSRRSLTGLIPASALSAVSGLLLTRARSSSARRSTTGSPRLRPRSRTPKATGSASAHCASTSLRCILATSPRSPSPMSLESCDRWPRRLQTNLTPPFALSSIMLRRCSNRTACP